MKPRERPATGGLGLLLALGSSAIALAVAVGIAVTERPREEAPVIALSEPSPRRAHDKSAASRPTPPREPRLSPPRARPIPIATTRSSR